MVPHPSFVPAWLTSSAVVLGALSLFGMLLRLIGPWRKQITEAEERLRKELMNSHARCEADLKIVKHRERGSRQLIYSLLHLFDMPDDQRKDMLTRIKLDLAALEHVEATEAASVLHTMTEITR